jgi:hypothetical protein
MDLDTPDCDTAFSATFTGPPPSSTPQRLNGTFSTAGRPGPAAAAANTTFDKLSPAADDIRLNATFNKLECSEIVSSPVGGGGRLLPASGGGSALLNATFDASRGGGGGGDESGTRMRTPPAGLNATFNRSNSSGGPAGGGFGGRGSNGSSGGINQRKMSEDRLSSASSG